MGEQQEVIAELRAAGVLAGIRWAYESAVRRSLASFCEADGHDHAWLGMTRFTLFRDRLDRVFSCERYAVSLDEGTRDLDVLYAELSEHDLTTMPRIAPGHVTRTDLYGSAGWTYADRRFLLAAGEFGRLRTLPWSERSTTKQIVAMQVSPDPRPMQPSLFEDVPGSSPFDELLRAAQRHLDPVTYMVAHSLDATAGDAELLFGRPKLNLRGDPAWHWHEDLLAIPLAGSGAPGTRDSGTGDDGTGGHRAGEPGSPAGTRPEEHGATPVPDAAVRLRVVKGERLA
jgi:hypothetical protein